MIMIGVCHVPIYQAMLKEGTSVKMGINRSETVKENVL